MKVKSKVEKYFQNLNLNAGGVDEKKVRGKTKIIKIKM